MLQCNFFNYFFLGLTTRACWLHLEKVMKNWRSRWKPKRYKATLSQHRCRVCVRVRVQVWVCVCVCSDLLCVCAVLLEGLLGGGRGENGSAQTGKVSDCVKAPFTSNLTWTAVAKVNIWTLFFGGFFQLLKGYMSNWTSPMTLPSPTCSTSKTFIHAGWVTDRWHLT